MSRWNKSLCGLEDLTWVTFMSSEHKELPLNIKIVKLPFYKIELVSCLHLSASGEIWILGG